MVVMCSTPFGVIEGFTRPYWGGRLRRSSAQRRSASSKGSQLPTTSLPNHRLVLNAVRRHRRVKRKQYRELVLPPECSTPFGVIEGFTQRWGYRVGTHSSAQRRSASSKGSPGQLDLTSGQVKCSTPFGVIEGFTGISRESATGIVKCSTPFGVIEGFTPSSLTSPRPLQCAQRRSASSKGSLCISVSCWESAMGAQRRSASSKGSPLSVECCRCRS